MLEGGRDAWSPLAYIIIQTLNQKRIMLCIWVSTNEGLGEARQLQHHFVTPPITVNRREFECFLCSALSAVACRKKFKNSYFMQPETRESREENKEPPP